VKAATFKANLSREEETAALVGRAAAELGPLTALVNSASIFENDDWQNASRASWDAHMETNLRAPFLLSQTFARQVPEKGAIVNIIDQRVLKPTPQFISYSLSKAGLYWLTTTLAQALGPNIRVNGIGPGPTMRNARQSEEDFARQRDATVLKRGAEPEDVAKAVAYLLDAEAVTGQMLAVDGGQHLIWQTPDVRVSE
jgi:NAD(P)-dependent dehydrogenase (short-subunit alcohol dehydrogenase family)